MHSLKHSKNKVKYNNILNEINKYNAMNDEEKYHQDISLSLGSDVIITDADSLIDQSPKKERKISEEKTLVPEEIALIPKDQHANPAFLWAMNRSWLRLFNNQGLRKIAHELIAGNIDAAINDIVQSHKDCPDLMRQIIHITDHRGRQMRGTLIQLAAMNFDFNLVPTEEMTPSFGAVERLVDLGLLSNEEIKNQLDAVLGPHSQKATNERTEKRKAAMEQLVNDIAELNIYLDADIRQQSDAIIHKFWTALNQEDVISEGLVFDPQILAWFIERFLEDDSKSGWKKRLRGTRNSDKIDLFWEVGFGSLQAADSACGLQCHRYGIYCIVENKKTPLRTSHFASSQPSFFDAIGASTDTLGSSKMFSAYTGRLDFARNTRPWVPRDELYGAKMIKKFIQTKSAAAQKLMQPPVTFMQEPTPPRHRSCCAIM